MGVMHLMHAISLFHLFNTLSQVAVGFKYFVNLLSRTIVSQSNNLI